MPLIFLRRCTSPCNCFLLNFFVAFLILPMAGDAVNGCVMCCATDRRCYACPLTVAEDMRMDLVHRQHCVLLRCVAKLTFVNVVSWGKPLAQKATITAVPSATWRIQ